MAHYLITIDQPTGRVLNAADCQSALQRAAEEFEGHLAGGWRAEHDTIIAIIQALRQPEAEDIRGRLESLLGTSSVTVTRLRSIQDTGEAADRLVSLDELVDPVDLASELSFPASDPPAWPSPRREIA